MHVLMYDAGYFCRRLANQKRRVDKKKSVEDKSFASSGGQGKYTQYRNVPWTVRHDINFEAITNLMHKYLYSYNITILDMFRALLCSSSGGAIVYVQHLAPSLSVSGRTAAHRE